MRRKCKFRLPEEWAKTSALGPFEEVDVLLSGVI